MTKAAADLILASASHSRRKLLEAAGVTFRTMPAGVDEAPIKRGHVPSRSSFGDLAAELAIAKALAVASHHPDALVIGADQVLSFEGEAFDKPDSIETARQQLQRLRGRSHRLETVVTCVRGGDVVWSHTEAPQLTMREFSSDWLEIYLAAEGEAVTETVGGYKIEGLGVQLFESMAGDYFAILGLPLLPLLTFLRGQGALLA
jgi:septum formation protein